MQSGGDEKVRQSVVEDLRQLAKQLTALEHTVSEQPSIAFPQEQAYADPGARCHLGMESCPRAEFPLATEIDPKSETGGQN